MCLLLVAAGIALLWSPGGSTEPPRSRNLPALSSPDCPPMSRVQANKTGGKMAPRKLAELPPADAYLAVVRQDGKCYLPEIVQYNVGGR